MNKFSIILKFLFDKTVPLSKKWWIILPIIYILSPIDLIPAPILGFSIIDDLVMFLFLYSIVSEKVNKYYFNSKDEKIKEDIIEDVEYEIHKEDED